MKEVLFATTNPAKIKRYKEELEKNRIRVLLLNDIDANIEVEETGKNALENAYIKAKAYYDLTGLPTIGMDNNLFIENIPEELQPGTHVRRVGGRVLDDDEMIEYYSNIARKYGNGKLTAKWVYGMVLISENKKHEYTWNLEDFYIIENPSDKRNPGYPMDSISIDKRLDKYFVDITSEEKASMNDDTNFKNVIEFIVKNLKD